MKCSKCKKKIEKTFLNKIVGTYVKGKPVCSVCQTKLKAKPKPKSGKK